MSAPAPTSSLAQDGDGVGLGVGGDGLDDGAGQALIGVGSGGAGQPVGRGQDRAPRGAVGRWRWLIRRRARLRRLLAAFSSTMALPCA